MDVKKVGVIGAGSMGSQIGMLCVLGGYTTIIQDINEQALLQAKDRLKRIMGKWVSSGKITNTQLEQAFNRLTFTTNLTDIAKDSDVIIEAIVEDVAIKQKLFKQLDELAPEHTILATNSSTIVNSTLASVTKRKDKVINMHFFYPPLVMDCVEIVKSKYTSDHTAQIIQGVCDNINRSSFLLEKEISGFVANRILGALMREAMELYEKGIADFKDIDQICQKALSHPLGPFEIADLSGVDVIHNVMTHQFKESKDPNLKPPLFLGEKIAEGNLGRKSGKGFYNYTV